MIERCRIMMVSGALLIANSATVAHMSPFLTVRCEFIDREGKAVSGLNVLVQTEDGRGEGNIENGKAEILLEISGSYRETISLAVMDSWRKPVMLVDSLGRRTDRLRFTLAGSGQPSDRAVPDFMKVLDRGTLSLGPRGCRGMQDGRSPALFLDWSPGDLSPEQVNESRQGAEIDRRNEEELRKRIEAIRVRGISP